MGGAKYLFALAAVVAAGCARDACSTGEEPICWKEKCEKTADEAACASWNEYCRNNPDYRGCPQGG
jgi:hypothetical protein